MMSEALQVDMTQDDGQSVKSFVSKHNGQIKQVLDSEFKVH